MDIILVDDEPLALQQLAAELLELDNIRIIGQHLNPQKALEQICRDRPDAVFLDIDMPEMTGIELAEQVLLRLPDTQIVFVTAYDDYAVKAFELCAQDYLVKPLFPDRLLKTITRLAVQEKLRQRMEPIPTPGCYIRCFQALQLERMNHGPVNVRWKTHKAQELFAYLLHHRGQPVRKQVILEQLFPGIEGKKGITQLYTAIYQVRKFISDLGCSVSIINCDEGYMLELNGTGLDSEDWENRLLELPALSETTLDRHLEVMQLFRGDYLADYHYLWAETEKRRLRALCLRHAGQIADHYMSNGRLVEAAAFYLQMQKRLPREEYIYFELMQLYDRLQDRFSVERQFTLLQDMLMKEFDAVPQQTVLQWYSLWRSKEQLHDS
ncbi:response regulator [Paenibacillus sp. y28]|uniref:response regulator n=1 Tax=Paenibacillus sp. y28 TaxID=3129110 RepID=UPI00301AE98F